MGINWYIISLCSVGSQFGWCAKSGGHKQLLYGSLKWKQPSIKVCNETTTRYFLARQHIRGSVESYRMWNEWKPCPIIAGSSTSSSGRYRNSRIVKAQPKQPRASDFTTSHKTTWCWVDTINVYEEKKKRSNKDAHSYPHAGNSPLFGHKRETLTLLRPTDLVYLCLQQMMIIRISYHYLPPTRWA